MKTSDQTDKIMPALVKALGSLKNPAFDSKNPHFGNSYASLAGILDSMRPVLAANEIALLQEIQVVEGGVLVTTRYLHSSGQWMETAGFTVPVGKGDAQAVCGASTYGRRYEALAFSGTVGDADDDGNAAAGSPPPPRRALKVFASAPAMTSADAGWESKLTAAASLEAMRAVAAEAQAAGQLTTYLISVGKRMTAEFERRRAGEAELEAAIGKAPTPEQAGASMAARSPLAPRNLESTLALIQQALPILGVEPWSKMVRDVGGDPAIKGYGLGLDSLKILADTMQAALAARGKKA